MAIFLVRATQHVIEETMTLIEADSPEEAKKKAIKTLNNSGDDVSWEYLDRLTPPEIHAIEEVDE